MLILHSGDQLGLHFLHLLLSCLVWDLGVTFGDFQSEQLLIVLFLDFEEESNFFLEEVDYCFFTLFLCRIGVSEIAYVTCPLSIDLPLRAAITDGIGTTSTMMLSRWWSETHCAIWLLLKLVLRHRLDIWHLISIYLGFQG